MQIDKRRRDTETQLPYPLNLLLDVYQVQGAEIPGLDSDRMKGFEYILNGLPKREREVIKMRYEQEMTLEACSDLLGLTRERVRQLEIRAVTMLGVGDNLRYVEDGYMIASGEVERSVVERLRCAEKHVRNEAGKYGTLIVNTNLSLRTKNALRRGGIHTVGELAEWSDEQLMKLSAFGRTSLQDCHKLLENMGLYQTGGTDGEESSV